MRCQKCGGENLKDARYCRFCGAELKSRAKGRDSKKKLPVIGLVLFCCLLCGAVVIVSLLFSEKKEKQFASSMTKGNRFLETMNYEQAEDQYLKALKIDKKDPETYLKLAEVYNRQNEPQKAKEILAKGKKETKSEKIEAQYSLYTYVEDVLIPELGQCEEGTYTCDYVETDYGMALDSVHSQVGVLTSRIQDFDRDGETELLVLVLRNNEIMESESGLGSPKRNAVYLQMYELENKEVILRDEMKGLGVQVLGFGDEENDGIFIKKYNGKTYICGSAYSLVYIWSDGNSMNSFVVFYEDGKFQKYCGTDQTIGGSDFRSLETQVNGIADALAQIGLNKEATQMRTTGMPKFDFVDEVDDMLMRVTGEYDWVKDPHTFWESEDVNDLGQVRLKLKLNWDQQQETESGEQLYQDVLNAYLSSYQTGFQVFDPYYIKNEEDLAEKADGDLKLYYALNDMNGDGIEELFIGEQSVTDDIYIIDTWKYSIDEPDRMIPDIDMGVVNICSPCEGGVYQVWVWESSFEKVWKYYSLSDDGISYGEIEEIRLSIDNSDIYEPHPTGREEKAYYYSSPEHLHSEITEEQFEEIQSKYKEISLDWKPLESWKQAE